ncbi:MAG: transglycosylase SLT domain-containing protein [Cocleimonas sp.]
MAINKKIKATASLLATFILWTGFNSPVFANPNDRELHSVAKELGLLRYVKQPAQQRAPQFRPQQARQQAVKYDPYAARRKQILLQNIARKKAYQARLLQLQRSKYQRVHQKKVQEQKRHGNVWNRLYQGFQIRNYNRQPLVKKYTAQFSKNPRRIQRLADRSSQYLYMVVNELNRRKMPTELALLPFVESAYRNQAYSHAGAAGMWQFIPATGRRFGLQQTRSYDARLDPFKSTKAAFDYLQRLNREFRGDWLLSLAAYNAGEYRVHKEIAKNRARGKRTDFWSLNLPRETKQYVPRLLAFKEIFRNPRHFRVQLRGIPNTHALTEIQVNKPVDLKKAALTAGLPADTLLLINSGFLHGITTPRFSNRIILPRQHAGRLSHVIQRLPPAADVHNLAARKSYRGYKKRSRRGYVFHKVRRGDNLYRIARKHGITVKQLKRLNNLRSNKIRPGKRLKIVSKSRSKRRVS